MQKIRAIVGEAAFAAMPYTRAHTLVLKLVEDSYYEEFLTLPAYAELVEAV
jgi:hypothetical protein